jgi:hypothetical protein
LVTSEGDTKVRDAVFGNVGTIITFRVGAPDAEFLEKEFMPEFVQQDLVNLAKANVYVKLMIDGVSSRPFSAQTLPPQSMPLVSQRDVIIKNSQQKYGTPRRIVEEHIANEWATPGDLAIAEKMERRSERPVGEALRNNRDRDGGGQQQPRYQSNSNSQQSQQFRSSSRPPERYDNQPQRSHSGVTNDNANQRFDNPRPRFNTSHGANNDNYRDRPIHQPVSPTSRQDIPIEKPMPPRAIEESQPSQKNDQNVAIVSKQEVIQEIKATERPVAPPLSALRDTEKEVAPVSQLLSKNPPRELPAKKFPKSNVDITALRKAIHDSLQHQTKTEPPVQKDSSGPDIITSG